MKTIRITIDDKLLAEIDSMSHTLGLSRSACICLTLQQVLHIFRIRQLEDQHIQGYTAKPLESGEFDLWEAEQSWYL